MRILIKSMIVAAILTGMSFRVQAQTEMSADAEAILQARQADFVDFKQRVYKIIGSFDRQTTTQADIEAVMDLSFLPDAQAKSFEIDPSPDKKVIATYKSLKVQQYVLPSAGVNAGKPLAPGLEKAILYGFENNGFDFPYDRDTCLSLHELKTRFVTDSGWKVTQLGMFYPGLTATRKGAKIMAFITKDSFYLSPEDESELEKLTETENWFDNAKKRARYDVLRANMDGCVFLLDIF